MDSVHTAVYCVYTSVYSKFLIPLLFQYRESKAVKQEDTAGVKTLLLKFTRDIVAGMKYLSCKGFIHRDLAARNILISEGLTAKVTETNSVEFTACIHINSYDT